MIVCSICADELYYNRGCDQSHPGVCHPCWQISMAGNPLDYRAHDAPREPQALTPREQAAVAAYQAHVVRVMGAAPLVELVTEEGEP